VERVDGKVQGEEGVRLFVFLAFFFLSKIPKEKEKASAHLGRFFHRRYTDPACPLLLSFLHRQLTYPSGPVREKRAEEVVDLDGRTTRGILVGLGDESVGSFSHFSIVYHPHSISRICTETRADSPVPFTPRLSNPHPLRPCLPRLFLPSFSLDIVDPNPHPPHRQIHA
jgi:hypothetical protein